MSHLPLAPCGAPTASELLEQRLFLAADYAAIIDNPYLPLIPGSTYVYRGTDDTGRSLRSRVNVINQTMEIDGVTTTVVRERLWADGQLVGDSHRFYAQDLDGTVWRFDDVPTIAMPAQPSTGQPLSSAGNVTDQATILATGALVKAPFATFADTVTIEGSSRQTYYAPGFGAVLWQPSNGANVRGGESMKLAYVHLEPHAFAERVNHPYYPLTPGVTLIYRGVDEGVPTRQRFNVIDKTHEITGVSTTVVRVREYAAGELVEDTRDFYAQDLAGNVWYFGEHTRQFADGRIVGTDGSWEAGVNGAQPGIFMPARPAVGDSFRLENASGIAEDQATVLGKDQRANVPYSGFGNALRVLDATPLEPDDNEVKYYVPHIGLIMQFALGGEDQENSKLAYIIVDEPTS